MLAGKSAMFIGFAYHLAEHCILPVSCEVVRPRRAWCEIEIEIESESERTTENQYGLRPVLVLVIHNS